MNTNNERVVVNEELFPVLKELLDSGKDVSLNTKGCSMIPFIHERDTLYVAPAPEVLKRGDMAVFQRMSGEYVMHRIRYVRDGANGTKEYYFIGDAQNWTEGPIFREQIFGLVTAVKRRGKWTDKKNFVWWFYRHVWLWAVPVRRLVFKVYGMTVGKLRKR